MMCMDVTLLRVATLSRLLMVARPVNKRPRSQIRARVVEGIAETGQPARRSHCSSRPWCASSSCGWPPTSWAGSSATASWSACSVASHGSGLACSPRR